MPSTSSRTSAGQPRFPLSPVELQRWIRFSAKGGVGRAKATVDRVSEGEESLMMLEGDEIVVLMDLGDDTYLGHCEGVVGLFHGQDVQFLQSKLKRPVMTPRSSPSANLKKPTSDSLKPGIPPPPALHDAVLPHSAIEATGNGRNPEDERVDRRIWQDAAVSGAKSGLEAEKETVETRVAALDLRSRRRVGMEGLGIEVRLNERSSGRQSEQSLWRNEDATDNAHLVTRSPDLAGSFQPLSHSPSTPSLDDSQSPSYSSVSHTPSLVTSPHSDATSHSTPNTPFTQTPGYLSASWNQSDFPSPPSSHDEPIHNLRRDKDDLDGTTPTAEYFPSSVIASLNATTSYPNHDSSSNFSALQLDSKGMPAPALHSSFSTSSTSPTFDSLDFRQQKSSGSTIASTISQPSPSSPSVASSLPGSVPGTPGEDNTLAFIFDSYRYSVTPSIASGGGTVASPYTVSPVLAMRENKNGEEVEDLRYGTESVEQGGGARSFGAASELRERILNGEAVSALPPHISPTRSRFISASSSSSSLDGVQIPRRSHIFPRSSTNDSLASFPSAQSSDNEATPQRTLPRAAIEVASSDNLDPDLSASRRLFQTFFSPPQSGGSSSQDHSDAVSDRSDSPERFRPAMQRRRKSSSAGVKGLQISAPTVPMPSSIWRSPNDTSPVTQVMLPDTTDVFVTSSGSSQSHGRLDSVPQTPSLGQISSPSTDSSHCQTSSSTGHSHFLPSSQTSLDHDHQYATVRSPRKDLIDNYGPSPSSSSFHSSASTDEGHGTFNQIDSPPPRSPALTNKLRKKPSFRLRPSQSSSHLLLQSDSQSSVNLASLPPTPLRIFPVRSGSDPFNASSPPNSPARNLTRKNSIGSKFSRKSSERDKEKEREKKVDYGAGISNKDFEEETVQIGTSAFEIVKPYVALLSQEDDYDDRSEPSRSQQLSPSQQQDYLTTPLRPSPSLLSINTPHQNSSLATSNSHFSPPTPMSAEGDERSVEDHRAKELKWVQTLASGITAAQVRKSKKMRALVQSGIPSSVRGKVWAFLAESNNEKKPDLYSQLCSLGEGEHSTRIEQDLDSLLLDNPQFAFCSAGREDLVAVLSAFSHFDRQLGYYPGLVNVVALLLTQMPAEESFYTLVSLVKNYGFRQFFRAGQEELRLETIAFSFLLNMVEPKIARRLRELEIQSSDYLPFWLSTFFLSILPLPTVLRVVDSFLLDPKTRYRAPLAILQLSQYTDTERFPSRDAALNYILAPPPTAFTPSILGPAISNYKLSDDKVKRAIKKAAQEMLGY